MTTRIDVEKIASLAAKATPGPWQAEDCEGELAVTAGSASTVWRDYTDDDGKVHTFGTSPSTYKSTDQIYAQDLETWDEGEDVDDDQRRADAELIVALRNEADPMIAAVKERDALVLELDAANRLLDGAVGALDRHVEATLIAVGHADRLTAGDADWEGIYEEITAKFAAMGAQS